MNSNRSFKSVWEALEDDPVRVQNLRLRSELLMRIAEELRARKLTQVRAAELLCLTQPRVCALLQGKIEKFEELGSVSFMSIRPLWLASS